ncbi:MAG: glycosyltransferase family 2 protein [Deltaproteobacteria bacterium]|nr:glycosyltransferase family 2 protein [bacterium]MCB9479902.1 glycosyltransferase family 2 protein [Deltaproteobacteria bacterium]MCB9489699.1 glycosyltransferase family 2 protein [Deltaproteobacteria bacterium]
MTHDEDWPVSLSVVVPFKNAYKTLGPLAKALREQADRGVEFLGIDDGSDDGGAEILEAVGFAIHRFERSRGPAAARNEGVHAAKGEVILFLDADVVPLDDLIAHVRGRFTHEPTLLALSGVYHPAPANRGFFPLYKALLCYAWFDGKARFGSLETACAAVRRRAFLDAGGFDESFTGADVEDYELGYRLGGSAGIEIDHAMRVKHHFPGFFANLKNFAKRSYQWAMLKRPRTFDTVATTPREGAASLSTYAVIGLLAATIVTGQQVLGYATLAAVATQLQLRRGFYLMCHENEGPRFTVLAVLVTMANDLVVVPAVAAGTMRRLLGGASKA